MTLRIYNSRTRTVDDFHPLHPGKVGMYVCGMTVYDLCHLGHARMMMAFDIIQRWLRASGYEVTYVRNITDIDDKIIKRAVERGITIRQLTDEMVEAMHQDITALGILPPDQEPRATEFVPQMLSIISQLQKNGLAYQSADGDVNYSVRLFKGYGKLSGKSLDELRAGERVAVLGDKQDPLDFVLWKSAKADEPQDAKWDSQYGVGRPGWHIECSALALRELGTTIDLHGGGSDLIFPHHECERAQSEAATGQPFVKHWMHVAMVSMNGHKMSKSRGNLVFVDKLRIQHDPMAIRLGLIEHHYRTEWEWDDGLMVRNEARLSKWKSAALVGNSHGDIGLLTEVRSSLDDDLDTPTAVALVDAAVSKGIAVGDSARLLGVVI